MTRITPRRILIVEDEALIALMIEDAVVDSGHVPVGVADTCADALGLARRLHPDLVLCDVKLADGDSGLDVAAALVEMRIPCLFVSGNRPEAEIGRALAIGCLEKPFNPRQIGDVIDVALAVRNGCVPSHVPMGLTLY